MAKKNSRRNSVILGWNGRVDSKDPTIEELRRKEAMKSKRRVKKRIDRFC